MKRDDKKFLRWLTVYYGILQSLHLLVLVRAGILILNGVEAPFPILPPPNGWHNQTMPFMIGLAATDLIGILIGIIFAAKLIFKRQFNPSSGLFSLTIFITGAIIFAAGTFPSGAWSAHPIAYWVMVFLFIPTGILYFILLRSIFGKNKTIKKRD